MQSTKVQKQLESGLRKSRNELRYFLARLVNASADPSELEQFWDKFKAWFRVNAFHQLAVQEARADVAWGGAGIAESEKFGRNKGLLAIRNYMREAWETDDLSQRKWLLWKLLGTLNGLSAAESGDGEQAPSYPAADAIIVLWAIAHKLKLCDNPNCTSPERYLIFTKRPPLHCYPCRCKFISDRKSKEHEARKEKINARRRREYRKENGGKVRHYRRHSAERDA